MSRAGLWDRFRRSAPHEVIDGLMALQAEQSIESPSWKCVDDMLLYAMIGRDRRKLTMEYVDRTRKMIREQEELFGRLS